MRLTAEYLDSWTRDVCCGKRASGVSARASIARRHTLRRWLEINASGCGSSDCRCDCRAGRGAAFTVVRVGSGCSLDTIRGGTRRLVDVLFVAFHWGVERFSCATDHQRAVGRAAVDAGADIVWRRHSHCIQDTEEYSGRPIYYGWGAFAFYRTEPEGAAPRRDGGATILRRCGEYCPLSCSHRHRERLSAAGSRSGAIPRPGDSGGGMPTVVPVAGNPAVPPCGDRAFH